MPRANTHDTCHSTHPASSLRLSHAACRARHCCVPLRAFRLVRASCTPPSAAHALARRRHSCFACLASCRSPALALLAPCLSLLAPKPWLAVAGAPTCPIHSGPSGGEMSTGGDDLKNVTTRGKSVVKGRGVRWCVVGVMRWCIARAWHEIWPWMSVSQGHLPRLPPPPERPPLLVHCRLVFGVSMPLLAPAPASFRCHHAASSLNSEGCLLLRASVKEQTGHMPCAIRGANDGGGDDVGGMPCVECLNG